MSNPPIPSAPPLFQAIELAALADELLSSARAATDGKASRTLLKLDTSTVVLIALREGARMAEHSAPSSVVIVPLRGRVTFTSTTAETSAETTPAQCLFMGPRVRHDVVANEDSVFLLVVGGTSAKATD